MDSNLIDEDFIEFLDIQNRVALCEINASTLKKISYTIPERRTHAKTVVQMRAIDSAKILFRFLIADYLEAHHGYLELEDNPYMNVIWNELVGRIIKTTLYIHKNFDENRLEFEAILLEHYRNTPELFFEMIFVLDLKSAPLFLIAAEERIQDPGNKLIKHFYDKYEKIQKTKALK